MNVHLSRLFYGLLCTASIVLSSAGRSEAAQESQVRDVPAFDRILLTGALSADITAGAHAQRVTVSAESGTIGRVTTTVENRTLIVGMRSGADWSGRSPNVTIDVPALAAFSNEGAGSVRIGGLTGGDFALSNAGAASVVAAGRAARETIELAGAGQIDAAGVAARDVTVDNNGIGSVKVRASGKLTMNVNGIGEIRYAGQPTSVESHVNGIGRISRL